jgi:hydroxypyruvate isomerase
MPAFSANLNFLFNEVPFMERFAAAARAGFQNVEFMFPYDYDQKEIKRQLARNGLKLVLINLPAGNWDQGDRGLAADPTRKAEFKLGVQKAVETAGFLEVGRANCLAGNISGAPAKEAIWENLLDNISYAASEFKKVGLDLMVEPVNHFDMPGFYLNTTAQVLEVIRKLNQTNIYLQYDIYHAEREGEDHAKILANYLSQIGHIQIADNPGRNEPGTGVIPVQSLFDTLDEKGYTGYIGMEYKPTAGTVDSLAWVEKMGYSL